ncbi:MAG: YhbD family protein [Bacillota bacterium]
MDQELLSKKELLELTCISYGQLYRWKRKNLIPEEWFIRKSSFTGQETFFPKEKIIERIDKIKGMKDDLSLDDLADMFSPDPINVVLTKKELLEHNIVSRAAIDLLVEELGDAETYYFEQILFANLLDQMLQAGEISLEEGKTILQVLGSNYPKFEGKNCELICLRKFGVFTCLLVSSPSEIFFENNARVIARLNLSKCIEQLKIRIG